jgi:mono/diheme cytochrome c family protein
LDIELRGIVRAGEGRPERGMPAFGTLLTPQQIHAIYAYVKGRAEGRITAGRPERPGA